MFISFSVDKKCACICLSAWFILVLQNGEEGDVATLRFLFKVQSDLLPAGTGELLCQAQLFIDAYEP